MIKLVHGVGVNDAEYVVTKTSTTYLADGKRIQKKTWVCPFYQAWKSMLYRCYTPIKKHESYSGCEVCEEWRRFSNFRQWMSLQQWQGNQLDKDLLFPGNKIYSPETCAFVSGKINSFVLDCSASKGEWPIGVHYSKANNGFVAQCNNPISGKKEHLGTFETPSAAHKAWRARKHELACIYAGQQADARISDALRNRYLEVLQ
jgi:hypothetical protein